MNRIISRGFCAEVFGTWLLCITNCCSNHALVLWQQILNYVWLWCTM